MAKEIADQVKRIPKEWEIIIVSNISDKELIFRIYKEL